MIIKTIKKIIRKFFPKPKSKHVWLWGVPPPNNIRQIIEAIKLNPKNLKLEQLTGHAQKTKKDQVKSEPTKVT